MEKFRLLGTVVNAAVVILGSAIGLLVHLLAERRKTPKRESQRNLGHELSSAVMIGLGLCAFLIGVQGAIKAQNILLVILSMAIGAAIGTLLNLDGKIRKLGDLGFLSLTVKAVYSADELKIFLYRQVWRDRGLLGGHTYHTFDLLRVAHYTVSTDECIAVGGSYETGEQLYCGGLSRAVDT